MYDNVKEVLESYKGDILTDELIKKIIRETELSCDEDFQDEIREMYKE